MIKGKFSKVIVALIIIMNVTFTAVVLYIFHQTGYEPTALIGAWFAFTTGELFFLADIKKKEDLREVEKNKIEAEGRKKENKDFY